MAQAVIKGGYYPSWASNLPPNEINTDHFTHIYYAFVNPDKVTFEFDIDQSTARTLRSFTSTLRQKNPPVKTLVSLGGYDDELLAGFARMASNLRSRSDFVSSCIDVAREHGFDGIDVDWEYPRNPVEMNNFSELLKEFRVVIQREASLMGRTPLLLTAAVYYTQITYQGAAYPADSMSNNLDWVNVMTYDYHGSWTPNRTGAHAALFDPNGTRSTSYGLQSWIDAGVPRSKLIMGLPLYGRTWKLSDPRVHGIGAPAVGVGPGENGMLTYAEVLTFNRENNADKVRDQATVSDYSYSGRYWVGYDRMRTVEKKVRHARQLGLRGHFFWALNGDYEWHISERASRTWSE